MNLKENEDFFKSFKGSDLRICSDLCRKGEPELRRMLINLIKLINRNILKNDFSPVYKYKRISEKISSLLDWEEMNYCLFTKSSKEYLIILTIMLIKVFNNNTLDDKLIEAYEEIRRLYIDFHTHEEIARFSYRFIIK